MTTQTVTHKLTIAEAHKQGPLQYVEPDKVYRAKLHLGASRTWREYGSGKWVRGESEELPNGLTVRHYRHELAVHNVGPIKGSTLNGLIASHNKFLGHNSTPEVTRWEKHPDNGQMRQVTRQNVDAIVGRALLVSDIREAVGELPDDESPKQRQQRTYSEQMNMIAAMGERIAQALEKSGGKR